MVMMGVGFFSLYICVVLLFCIHDEGKREQVNDVFRGRYLIKTNSNREPKKVFVFLIHFLYLD